MLCTKAHIRILPSSPILTRFGTYLVDKLLYYPSPVKHRFLQNTLPAICNSYVSRMPITMGVPSRKVQFFDSLPCNYILPMKYLLIATILIIAIRLSWILPVYTEMDSKFDKSLYFIADIATLILCFVTLGVLINTEYLC